ncbi:MAG: hypothetical protein K8R23_12270 [Chthoniobacter sp.]|nr:hypothetical protein [Chthoniobacter sp.]
MCPRPPLRCASFLLGVVLFWVSTGEVNAAPPLPPPPPGLIQDAGNVLLPEAARALSERLQTAAVQRGIWVYVVTLPSLGVPPSKQRERLVNMGDLYRHGWLGDRVGVVLLVDDESGAAMIAASEAANRQYPPLQRNMLMEEPLRLLQKEPLRRDKIEKTALTVVAVISHLQDESEKSKRRDLWVNVAMAVISIAGVGLIVWVKWVREKKTGSRADVPTQTGDQF